MRHCVCPGSFDPITNGHIDIITRCLAMFDKVTVLVMGNPNKKPVFTVEQRIDMIETVIKSRNFKNVTVDTDNGLLAEYGITNNVTAFAKGLRAVSDFEYEFQMALLNKKIAPDIETVFLTTRQENMYLSSSMVKQIAIAGGDISDFVPQEIEELISKKLREANYVD